VSVTASRVFVDALDQLLDGAFAVADDVRGRAFGDRHEFIVHDERAKIFASNHLFDYYPFRFGLFLSEVKRGAGVFQIFNADGRASAVIAIKRLDDDGKPD